MFDVFWFRNRNKEPYHLPLPEGTHATGCIDVMTGFTKEANFFRLFYPSDVPAEDVKKYSKRWVRWNPDERTVQGMALFLRMWIFLLKLIIWLFGRETYIPTIWDTDISKKVKKMPVVLFSHGYGSIRYLCSTVCNELASRGCLVLSIEHRDGSACITYYYESEEDLQTDKKTFINHLPVASSPKESFATMNEQLIKRSNECSSILDWVKQANEGTATNILPSYLNINHLKGKIDLSNVIIMGHSFGGTTVLTTLSTDNRFKTGILLDGWMFPIKDKFFEVSQPLLFINSETFHIKANIDVMKKYTSQPGNTLYTMRNTTHESHGDTAVIYGYWLNLFMKKLTARTALKLQNHLILDFLRKQLAVDQHTAPDFEINEEQTTKFLKLQSHNLVQDFILYSKKGKTKVSIF